MFRSRWSDDFIGDVSGLFGWCFNAHKNLYSECFFFIITSEYWLKLLNYLTTISPKHNVDVVDDVMKIFYIYEIQRKIVWQVTSIEFGRHAPGGRS